MTFAALSRQQDASLSFVVYAVISIVAALILIFWLWTLRDCLKNEADGSREQMIWAVVIVVFFPLVGAFLYQVGRRKNRIKELGR